MRDFLGSGLAKPTDRAEVHVTAGLYTVMEAVHHYEGTVNQVMGDGIMALFGARIVNAAEKHALQMIESDRQWKDLSVSTDFRSAVVRDGGDAAGPK